MGFAGVFCRVPAEGSVVEREEGVEWFCRQGCEAAITACVSGADKPDPA